MQLSSSDEKEAHILNHRDIRIIEGCNKHVFLKNISGYYTALEDSKWKLKECMISNSQLTFLNSSLNTLYSIKFTHIVARNSTIGYLNVGSVNYIHFSDVKIEVIENLHFHNINFEFINVTANRIVVLDFYKEARIINSTLNNVS